MKDLLLQLLEKNKDTHARLADALGVTKKKLRRKLNRKSEFTLSELRTIIDRYRLTPVEVYMVFFSPDDQKSRR